MAKCGKGPGEPRVDRQRDNPVGNGPPWIDLHKQHPATLLGLEYQDVAQTGIREL